MTDSSIHRPLVIFALDTADPDLITQWAQAGDLPSIASIMQRGYHGRFAGLEMLSTHAGWATLFSGISMAQHARYIRRRLTPGTYDLQDIGDVETDAPPFWSQLVDHDARVAIIDAPETSIVAGLNGIQVANLAVHPDFRRRGLALGALEHIDELARERGAEQVFLEVRETNVAAQLLYQKAGYTAVGIASDFYGEEAAYRMVKRFGS